MRAEIISIGHELTSGAIVNTNARWLADQLSQAGLIAGTQVTVGDHQADIEDAIRTAANRSDLVVITGGLGPTADDLTREGLAAAMDQPLEFDEDSWKKIENYFAQLGRTPGDSNRRQAMCPRTARLIPNSCGTAPGIHALVHEAAVFVLPGVPREMRAMFERDVGPEVSRLTGGRAVVTRTLHCFGAGEANIGEQLSTFMDPARNPRVGTCAEEGVISIRICADGDSRDAAALADSDVAAVRNVLGPLVFGEDDDTLASVLGRLLIDRGATVSTAESCTGGLLAAELTDVPGSSAYFLRGFVTYANEAKTQMLGVPAALIVDKGAVSREVAVAMAEGCRRVSETDYALGITGIAGPGGATADKPVGLVYIALASSADTTVRECRFPSHLSRRAVRDRACKTALNMFRKLLL
ncbi:MAG: competence/damage-inducible protein A [Planctomycetes bacterium]|nr:competence/damage-inducible protein A [Planctomycetota bacterium]